MTDITIHEVKENEREAFNHAVQHPVQSWEWGEFRQESGNKVIRLGAFEGTKLIEGYQIIIHKIPKTNYSLGMFTQGPAPSQKMLDALKDLAKKENLLFIRMEPRVAASQMESEKWLNDKSLRPGHKFFNKSTYVLDLTKSEEELLKAMHPKTRYNIRVAEKHGVEVKEDNSPQAFEKYLNLMDETTKRQGYFAHTENYHKRMWKIFSQANIAHLFTASYQGKILSTFILFSFGDSLYYPYGASSQENREVMASTKLMWEAIKFGKSQGLKKFDLWGGDEGMGYTRFKAGFGPELVNFIGTWDLVTNSKFYPLYRAAEELRMKLLKTKAKLFPKISSFR